MLQPPPALSAEAPFRGLERLPCGPPPEARASSAFEALARDGAARIAAFERERAGSERAIAAHQASDGRCAYHAIAALIAGGQLRGERFCEWGSGFGVATCAAALLGLSACGIESELELVIEARRLAADHAVEARFVHGSYRPPGTARESVERGALDGALGFSPLDFDLIYVYPWPAERRLVGYLFSHFAPRGALLLEYLGAGRAAAYRQP